MAGMTGIVAHLDIITGITSFYTDQIGLGKKTLQALQQPPIFLVWLPENVVLALYCCASSQNPCFINYIS